MQDREKWVELLKEGCCPGVEGNALTVMAGQCIWLPNALLLLSGQRKTILERMPAIY